MAQCQSCSMPLKDNPNNHGTKSDGSLAEKYCNLCYENGKFKQPDLTLEEMKQICDNALKEKGWIKPLRWMALMQLSRLERWKGR